MHGAVDPECLVFADEVGDTGCYVEYFISSAAAASDSWQQSLSNNANQSARQLGSDLVLKVARKSINDPVHCSLGTVGVKCAEDNVSCFSSADGCFNCFKVSKFAHENDIGVLPQRPSNRLGETGNVDSNLALIDRALDVIVVELDRILDGDDVMVEGFIEQVDQTCQCRTLS